MHRFAPGEVATESYRSSRPQTGTITGTRARTYRTCVDSHTDRLEDARGGMQLYKEPAVSSFAPFAEDLRHVRDLRQKLGSCVKIPIRTVDLAVAHISHQRQHVRINRRSIAGTGFKYSNRKTVTKVMDARAMPTRPRVDSNCTDETQEYRDDTGISNATPA